MFLSLLVLGILCMLGARSRAKIECFKMHIRLKVRTFIEIWILSNKIRHKKIVTFFIEILYDEAVQALVNF